MRGQTYVILTIVFIILIAVFAVMNVDSVNVNYLFWTIESPLILVILFSVLMGGIATGAVGAVKTIHLQRENKELQVKNEEMKSVLKKHDLLSDDENDQVKPENE